MEDGSSSIDVTGKVLVCGGGIGGLALGVALHKVGIPTVILERGHELRSAGAGIRLQTNAWHALEQLGVADTLRRQHVLQDSFQVHRNTGKYIGGAAYSKDEENRGVVRNELIMALAEALPKGCLFLGCNVQAVWLDEHGSSTVTLSDGTELRPKVLVGADGANSKVAKALGLPAIVHTGHVGIRAIARFGDDMPAMTNKAQVIIGGPDGQFDLLFPLTKDVVYYASVILLPEAEARRFDTDRALEYLHANAKNIHKRFNIPLIISRIGPTDIYAHRLADRLPEKGKAWGKGTVTVIGDAAHATSPFLGQGGSMAMEDAVEFAAGLQAVFSDAASPAVLAGALRAIERRRASRTHDMVKLARYNVNLICRKRTWLGVWLRDLFMTMAVYFTRASFYTNWDATLATGGVKMKAT